MSECSGRGTGVKVASGHAGCGTPLVIALNCSHPPLVAQLVERWTVGELQESIGRWFKSGPEDVLAESISSS